MFQTESVSPELLQILRQLMDVPLLANFRLVGGTALSLQRGHRMSIDIDLFTDAAYGSTDFGAIEAALRVIFPHVENNANAVPGIDALPNNLGLHLYIGLNGEHEPIKTDILYWDAPFILPVTTEENIRFASTEDIAAMKLDVVARGGRKKDYWDLAELLDTYSLQEMLEFYKEKYPYHEPEEVISRWTDFNVAEMVPDPICLKGRNWEMVKEIIRKNSIN